MNTESEAASVVANQVIHIVVEGFEMILRLSGKGVKELATMLYVAFKNHEGQDTPGKQKLAKILQTGTPRIFDLPKDETKNFAKEAKRYGISYCVLKPSKLEDKTKFEVIVHQEDAERVSRIMNRVHTATVEMVPEKEAKDIPLTTEADLEGTLSVDTQEGHTRQDGATEPAILTEDELLNSLFVETQVEQPATENIAPSIDVAQDVPDRDQPDLLDDLGLELFSEEGLANATPQKKENPIPSRTQPNERQSEPFSKKSNSSLEKKTSKGERSSVREELREIKKELAAKKVYTSEKGREMPKVPTPKVSGKER